MAKIEGYFEYPDDLTPGRSKDGGIHHNLYDEDGRLVEHGRFVPHERPESAHDFEASDSRARGSHSTAEEDDEIAGILIALVLVGIIAAAQSAPHLKRWWIERALPAFRTTANRVLRRADRDGRAPEPRDEAQATSETSGSAGHAKEGMSSAEARDRVMAVALARQFIEEQMAVLREATIDLGGGQGALELAVAVDRLTSDQVAEGIERVLEGNPDLLEGSQVAALGRAVRVALATGSPVEVGGLGSPLRLNGVWK